MGALLDLAGIPGLKTSFAPPAEAAPPPPLLLDTPAICDPAIGQMHAACAGPVEALGCYRLEGAVIAGPCHVMLDGAFAVAPDLTPAYWRGALRDSSPPDLTLRQLDHPVAVIATPGYREYGHWLLDILPRLWTLAAAGLDRPELRILLPADTPAFGPALLARLGIGEDRLLRHAPAAERIAAPLVLLPSLPHTEYRLHPAAAGYYDRLVARHAAPAAPRPTHLFLSRAQHTRPDAPGRHLRNHDEVRALMESCGYTTIAPETLPWPEQLALFAGARVVVGEHGSAMKNLVFTPAGAVAINIHLLNDTQSKIAALRRHHLIYLRAEDPRQDAGRLSYRVDLASLARCLAAAVAQAGLPPP